MSDQMASVQSYVSSATSAQNIQGFSTAVSALKGAGTIMSGLAGLQASNDQAGLLDKQAQLALQQGQLEAAQKARDVTTFQAQQASLFAKSGITLEGTPVQVLEKTRAEGQQEVNALRSRASAQAMLLNAQGNQTRNGGRAAFLKSIFGAATGGLDGLILGQKNGLYGGGAGIPDNGSPPTPGRVQPDGSIE